MKKAYITKKHMILEIISYVILFAAFILAVIGIFVLPEEIATHYDAVGNVDGYGSPVTLLIMPAILLISNLTCSLCIHLLPASCWSTSVKVKPGNEIFVFRDTVSMIVLMELEISVFGLFFTIACFLEKGKIMLPGCIVFLAVLFATIIIVCVKMKRYSR